MLTNTISNLIRVCTYGGVPIMVRKMLNPTSKTTAPTSLLIRGDNNNISNTIVFHHNFGYSWFSIGDNVSFSNHIM